MKKWQNLSDFAGKQIQITDPTSNKSAMLYLKGSLPNLEKRVIKTSNRFDNHTCTFEHIPQLYFTIQS